MATVEEESKDIDMADAGEEVRWVLFFVLVR